MQANRGYGIPAPRWSTTVAALLLMGMCHGAGHSISVPTLAAEASLSMAQAPIIEGAETDKPPAQPSITRGMGKESVRTVWGEPEEIRKIRTCFGWQEEWVYRGDPKRFGVSERILLFDEGEVLTEIK